MSNTVVVLVPLDFEDHKELREVYDDTVSLSSRSKDLVKAMETIIEFCEDYENVALPSSFVRKIVQLGVCRK